MVVTVKVAWAGGSVKQGVESISRDLHGLWFRIWTAQYLQSAVTEQTCLQKQAPTQATHPPPTPVPPF